MKKLTKALEEYCKSFSLCSDCPLQKQCESENSYGDFTDVVFKEQCFNMIKEKIFND